MSVREYAVLYLGAGGKKSGGSTGGGNVAVTAGPHVLDGVEHSAAADSTRLDATDTAHGLLPKLSGSATDALLGDGTWGVVATGAPTTADYLVGTAQGGLSAEIVVGTTPGGELGGTWASPTVDATHSGSAHLALGSTSSTAAAGDHAHGASGVGELVVVDGTTGPTGVIPNSYVEMTTPRTTTSATLVDITGATTTITIQRPSDIAVWMTCHVSASASCDLGLAISIDGTDHDSTDTHLTATDEGNVAIMHRTVSKLAPGTYTVKGRFQRTSGGGTPSVDRVDLLVSALTTSGPVLVTTDDETDYVYADLA